MEPDIKDACNDLRKSILQIGKRVFNLQLHGCFRFSACVKPGQDDEEMMANIILSYRHLEDARMRLGKVIQAYEGGVSIFDKQSTPTP